MIMGNRSRNICYQLAWVSCFINVLLFGLKYFIGIKIDSIAMKADAWHTLSDSLTSLIIIFSIYMAHKKADKQHPYGHGRAELIGTVIVGTLLVVVAFNFLKESIIRFQTQQATAFPLYAIITFAFTIIIKEILAQVSFYIGKKHNSQAIVADGWHHRSDAVSTIIIVIGALVSERFWWIDSILGMVVSVYIGIFTYKMLKNVVSALLGEQSEPDLNKKISKIVKKSNNLITRFHHLHVHKYGTHIELTFHICLPGNMKLQKAHDIVNHLEIMIRKELHMEATIHIEPC
jgi:cation diffusion facilitator family transporter